jgi:excisionase family DNA binding protein
MKSVVRQYEHGSPTTTKEIVGRPLYTTGQVARKMNVSKRTIYRMVDDQQLHPTRLRGCLRFLPEEIEEIIRDGSEVGRAQGRRQ